MSNGFYVDIEVDDKDYQATMQSLDNKMNPLGLASFLDQIVDPWLRNRIRERFATEGDDVTGRWHPLSRASELIRSSYGFPPSHPINRRTGIMENYLTTTDADVNPTGLGATLVHPPAGKAHSITDKKIRTAQGGSAHPPTQPRPVLGVNENDLLFITSSLTAWLIKDFIP